MCMYYINNKINQVKMDILCIMAIVKSLMALNEVSNKQINGNTFNIKVIEESQGPLRINLPLNPKVSLDSMDSESYDVSSDWEIHVTD